MWSLAEYAQSVRDLGASFGAVLLRTLATPLPQLPSRPWESEVHEVVARAQLPRHEAGPPTPPRRITQSTAAAVVTPKYRSARSNVGRRQGRGRL